MSAPNEDQQVEEKNITSSEYVKLNVGGMLFQTTISTLTKCKENMLTAMFTGQKDKTIDNEGWVLIDRSGKHFEMILNFLRDGTVPLQKRKSELAEIRAEANYFRIQELVELCDRALATPSNTHNIGPSYIIALLEPLGESVIKSLIQPTIVLEITNRTGKYPRNNIALFDKLACRFNKQIRFIRCLTNSDKCHWIFCSDGKLVDQVNCYFDNVYGGFINMAVAKLLQGLIPESES